MWFCHTCLYCLYIFCLPYAKRNVCWRSYRNETGQNCRDTMDISLAPDVQKIVRSVLPHLPFPHVDKKRIICMRSFGATSRARARIWSFPKIWQQALGIPAHYVIEVLSHHFDPLSTDDKVRVIIHELMHIPKNFSGALVPHRGRHSRIDHRTVERLFSLYKNSIKV